MGVINSIDLKLKDLKQVKKLLQAYFPNRKVWAYGSRVKWTAKPSSDLDIVIFSSPADKRILSQLSEAFEESDLSISVDAFLWDLVPENFQRQILEKYFVLQEVEEKVIPLVKLNDYCIKIGSGATPKGGSSVYLQASNTALIRSQNIYNNGFNDHGLAYITEDAALKLKNVAVEPNDILLNITGDSVARVCVVPEGYLPARVNQHVAIIRPKPDEFDAKYLCYVLTSPFHQANLLTLSSAGATRNALTKGMIESYVVPKPTLPDQIKIASILHSFDRKITLNRQINQTLEQMAQALFKSWFVDFDPVIDNALAVGNPIPESLAERSALRQTARASEGFQPLPEDVMQLFPSEFEESELGWVPKGWMVSRLDSILELVYGKALKKTEREAGAFPVYGSGGITGTHNESLVKAPGIIVGRKGTVGSLYWATRDFFPIDTVFYVRPKSELSLNYCFYLLKTLGLESMNTDAAVPGLNRNNAYRLLFVLPKLDVLAYFSNLLDGFRNKVDTCSDEIESLTNLRDTLLPKLISGELRLDSPEVEKAKGLVEAV